MRKLPSQRITHGVAVAGGCLKPVYGKTIARMLADKQATEIATARYLQ
jgi:hypothetical protein